MIFIPFHTFHGLQPLQEAYYRPFKVAFKAYKDLWNVKNKCSKCTNEDLAQWTSLALKNVLVPKDIISEFRATRIWFLDPLAMASKIGTREVFSDQLLDTREKEKILKEELSTAQEGLIHYYRSEEAMEED